MASLRSTLYGVLLVLALLLNLSYTEAFKSYIVRLSLQLD